MSPIDLNIDLPGLAVTDFTLAPDFAVVALASTAPTADCPRCGSPSRRVHSRYRRTVADLPCQDRLVALRLTVRRFRCCSPDCPQDVFCERLPGLVDVHARTSRRLTDAHRLVGLALGGEAGARLADRLDMPTSPDTLLRRVVTCSDEPAPPPRYVGVDDWAIRKGLRYGTVLIDLERGRVLDILDGRDGTALAEWLRRHPGVEVITRDRWAAYARAAAEAAPQAKQVADRWHLLKNLREAIERLLERHHAAVQECLQGVPPTCPGPVAPQATALTVPPPSVEPAPAEPRSPAGDAKRQRRVERFERVRELHRQGKSIRGIAREEGMSVRTVLRYLREGNCPDWKPGRTRPTRLDRFRELIDRRIREGCRNGAQLHRELTDQGCRASSSSVRRFLSRRLAATGQTRGRADAARRPRPKPPSAKALSFELLRRARDRKPDEHVRASALAQAGGEVTEALSLAAEFQAMARREEPVPLSEWLARADRSSCPEMRRFAEGLRQDEAAVAAALTEPWSNGPVEGQVNRLKVIKRQMYGRAGLKLLRARVVNKA